MGSRKFSHKVKTINMSTFTPAEVEALTTMGTKRARKIWLATFEEGRSFILDPEDPANVDKFMTLTYVDRKWFKAPGAAAAEEEAEKVRRKASSADAFTVRHTHAPSSLAIVQPVAHRGSNPTNTAFACCALISYTGCYYFVFVLDVLCRRPRFPRLVL